jgi:transcriptional regulator with XRE-family HTH domain
MSHEDLMLPPRSVLVPLEPIGLGTPLAESLESYVTRIAKHERVARFWVEQVVSRSGAAELARDRSRQQMRLDAPSRTWSEFAQRLATLTAQPLVARLGLGWLHEHVSRAGALRQHRAWCFVCVGEMASGSRKTYEPLVWSLAACKFCPLHGVPLQTTCSICGARKLARRVCGNWLECNSCGTVLRNYCRAAHAASSNTHAEANASFERKAATTIGDFVSVAHLLGQERQVSEPALPDLVLSALERGRATSQAHFARLCKVPKNTLNDALRGRPKANKFELLVRLATVADVSLAGLFDKRYWKVDARQVRICDIQGIQNEPPRRRVDWAATGRLGAQLLASRVISPGKLAQALRVDVGQMKALLPDLYELARQQWSRAEAQRRLEQQAVLDARVCRALSEAAENGRTTSARAIAAEIGLRRSTPAFRRAMDSAVAAIRARRPQAQPA